MIEGLWIVKFLTPNDPSMDLNGGVVVVESGKIFGGDSGYFYIGSMEPSGSGNWNSELTITRHDPGIESVFGDVDQFKLFGSIRLEGEDDCGRPRLMANLAPKDSPLQMTAELIRVADLP